MNDFLFLAFRKQMEEGMFRLNFGNYVLFFTVYL